MSGIRRTREDWAVLIEEEKAAEQRALGLLTREEYLAEPKARSYASDEPLIKLLNKIRSRC